MNSGQEARCKVKAGRSKTLRSMTPEHVVPSHARLRSPSASARAIPMCRCAGRARVNVWPRATGSCGLRAHPTTSWPWPCAVTAAWAWRRCGPLTWSGECRC